MVGAGLTWQPASSSLVEELGDAEVEQLHVRPPRRLRHEHVRRLEVAVDDEPAVRRGDGLADVAEEREPGVDAEAAAVGVVGDRLALDELQREVRPAVGGRPAVEEPGDAGVVEPREHARSAWNRRAGVGVQPGLTSLTATV